MVVRGPLILDAGLASRYLYKVAGGDLWAEWESLLDARSPDLLAILRVGAQLQAYLAAVEREALKAARGSGLTWAQLGDALGTTRQAVWQRATSWRDTPPAPSTARTKGSHALDEEVLGRLRQQRDDAAARRERIAQEMFDGAIDGVASRRGNAHGDAPSPRRPPPR